LFQFSGGLMPPDRGQNTHEFVSRDRRLAVNIDDHMIRAASAEPRDTDPSLIQSQGTARVPEDPTIGQLRKKCVPEKSATTAAGKEQRRARPWTGAASGFAPCSPLEVGTPVDISSVAGISSSAQAGVYDEPL